MTKLYLKNNQTIRVECDEIINRQIHERFRLFDFGAYFGMQQYAKRSPHYTIIRENAYVNMYDKDNKTLKSGLLKELTTFLKEENIEFDVDTKLLKRYKKVLDLDKCLSFMKSLTIRNEDKEIIEPYDFQYNGVLELLRLPQRLCLSVTSSGKSLIMYMLLRVMLQFTSVKKILILVPRVMLIKQLYDDWDDYSFGDLSYINEETVLKYSTSSKKNNFDKSIHICNFQGLRNLDDEFFKQYDMILCDEVHKSSNKTTQDIIEKCVNVKYLYGVTGTLPDPKKNEIDFYKIKSNFGEIFKLTDYKMAISEKIVTDFVIQPIRFNYNVNKIVDDDGNEQRLGLIEEKAVVRQYSKQRNNYLLDIATSEKNTIYLLDDINSYGVDFYQQAQKRYPNKKIHILNADTKADERDELRKIINKTNDNIIIATYALLSTGWSVKNLYNLVFLQSRKKHIDIFQSIGRVLRKHKDKSYATVYDVIDEFNYNNIYSNQYKERTKYYIQEEFKVRNEILFNIRGNDEQTGIFG